MEILYLLGCLIILVVS